MKAIYFFILICLGFSLGLLNVSCSNNNPETKTTSLESMQEEYDVLVYGNELPAIAAVVTAQRILGNKGKVLLARSNEETEPFGGLLVQGALAYLDRNQMNYGGKKLVPSSPFYAEFLKKAKVKLVSADPVLVDKAIRQMLAESGVEVLSGVTLKPVIKDRLIQLVEVVPFSTNSLSSLERERSKIVTLRAQNYIDATANADLAIQTNLIISTGFETLGFPKATLPVTPVFKTQNLSVAELQRIEEIILSDKELMDKIHQKVSTEHDPEFAHWLLKKINKPMYVGEDYIDVRSIALGAAYHLHQNKPFDFRRGFLFDRPNIAILREGNLGPTLSWNAFLYKYDSQGVIEIIQKGSQLTDEMNAELKAFESWLNSFSKNTNSQNRKQIKVLPPKKLYIRHSHNIIDVKQPLTGKQMVQGGTDPSESVGTFSYYMDVRGGVDGYHGTMPKPTFNFGIEHTLTNIQNLAVVGRSSGYFGLAPAAGRILELNTSVASYVGAAAALALQPPTNTESFDKKLIREETVAPRLKEARRGLHPTHIYSIKSSEVRKAVEKLTHTKTVLQSVDLSESVDLENII